MGRMILVLLALVSIPVSAAEDPRISLLEQQVRSLDRQVQALTRQLETLRNRPAGVAASPGTPATAVPADALPSWVDAAKWRKLRQGMSELDVIATLGPPSSMREEGGARVLLYAFEIGASGFLGGSVMLRDRTVAEVREPRLQ